MVEIPSERDLYATIILAVGTERLDGVGLYCLGCWLHFYLLTTTGIG